VLAPSAIPATGPYAAGISYESFNLSPQKYLQYLLSLCEKLGAKCITTEVNSFVELFHRFDNLRGVVNSTGLGAAKLVNDPDLFPTKGQSVMVRGQANRISTGLGDGWEAVVVPRYGENETFLGVSKIARDWYVNPIHVCFQYNSERSNSGFLGVLMLMKA
jgi:D-amino-acid oxidase